MTRTEPDDLAILPEGSLSGYDENPVFLHEIDTSVLADSMRGLQNEILKRRIHLIFGSCLKEDEDWINLVMTSYTSREERPK